MGQVSRRQDRASGFTMVELLIVISMILMLMAVFVVGLQSARLKARVSATKGTIERVGVALEGYHSKRSRYPSDGLESSVTTEEGTTLQSGAALTYALIRPVVLTRKDAAGREKIIGTSEPILELKDSELTEPLEDDDDAREMLDAWGNEFHYDNLSGPNGQYDLQDSGEVHLTEPDDHEDDPRESEFVARTGAQNTAKYDFWSHGPDGHTGEGKPEDAIANWLVSGNESESDD